MKSDPASILPDLYANIITIDGQSRIQTFDESFKHLEGTLYASPFDALKAIDQNGLKFLAWV